MIPVKNKEITLGEIILPSLFKQKTKKDPRVLIVWNQLHLIPDELPSYKEYKDEYENEKGDTAF